MEQQPNKITKPAIDFNKQQQQAIDLIYGPALVLAGPGSGKTTLLTKRIANILKVTDATANNILCLTFSETAVTTMQKKLVNLIGQTGYDVKIATYHSFCSELISTNTDFFNEYMNAQPADELKSIEIIETILNQTDYKNAFKKYKPKKIYSLIESYKRAYISPDDLTKLCLDNLAEIKILNQILNKYLEPSHGINKKSLALFESIYKEVLTIKSAAFDKDNLLPLSQLFIEELSRTISQAEESNKTKPLTKWKGDWLSRDSKNLWQIDDAKASKNQLDLAHIYQNYEQQLKERALFDFSDMILVVIEGLKKYPELKYSLQEKYQFILLDEFQDTNEVQFKLVELLSDNPVNEGQPNVMAVGDDDQAIYSFQGAHYSHMAKFYAKYTDVKLFSLTINYRSSPGLVSLNNAIRQQIDQSINLLPKTAVSSQENAKNEAIRRVELPLYIEQLAWVANFCHQKIKNGELKPEDIAIIAPKHSLLLDLIPFLHDLNIPITYTKKDNIIEQAIIRQILTMSELVIGLNKQLNVDHLWVEIISYDFWQLPTTLIWNIANLANTSHQSWTDILLDNQQTKEIALLMIRLAQIMPYTSFEEAIDYLIGLKPITLKLDKPISYTSPFYNYYFNNVEHLDQKLDYQQYQLIGQLITLRQTIATSLDQEINLEQFHNIIKSYQAAELKIVDNAAFSDNQHAINLLSIHSAKGMEFDCVILLSVLDSVWGIKTRGENNIKLPHNLRYINIDNKSDDDKLREFFVAISRAKRELIMTSYNYENDTKPTLRLKYLNESEDQNQNIISPLLPTSQIVEVSQFDSTNLNLDQLVSWHNRHLDLISHPDTRLLLAERLERFKLSATILNNFIDLVNSSPRDVFIKDILKLPSAKSIDVKYGSAFHKTLDWRFKMTNLTNSQPSLSETISQFEKQLDKLLISNEEKQLLLKRASNSLDAYYQQWPDLDKTSTLSEQQFNASLGNTKLTGKIDRLIVDEATKELTIIDFKTGKSYKESSNASTKLYTNINQLYFYKILVEKSGQFSQYNVNKGLIIHVEPDKSELITSHEIDFEDNESSNKTSLIKSVYDHIINLDFPDTQNFSKNLAGIKAFVEFLINN